MSLSENLKLPIDGMTCTGCAGRLQTALNTIEGIHTEVSFASESAEVTIDDSVDYDGTVKSILILIEKKGYKTALPPEDDRLNNRQSVTLQSSKNPHDSQVKTQELLIEGATCASCVNKIEKALNALPNVQQAQMNFALRTVSVTGDVAQGTLIKAIEAAGYNAKSTDNASDKKLPDEKEEAEEEIMDNLAHRVGVTEVNLVSRKLQLKGLTEFNRAKIISEIEQAVGVDNLTLDIKDGLLHIVYDVTQINLDAIKLVLCKHDAEFSESWWNHFKKGYYKFVDQNMLDNIKHKPSCCSRPPPGSTKHK